MKAVIRELNMEIYGIKIGKELRFFDCTYEIAKNNYNLYNKVKEKLEFNLGNSREEVREEIKNVRNFLEVVVNQKNCYIAKKC